MVFASPVFLFLFLPLSLALYFIPGTKRAYKNAVLLLASLFFYAWGEPIFVGVMLVSILWNYRCALGIDASGMSAGRKRWLVAAVAFDLLLMFLFKYLVFTFRNLGLLFGGTGEVGIRIELPIGISFFTFQIMSYVFDVYYKKTAVQENIFRLALYISMFPQLMAGPIVRYETVAQEIGERHETAEGFARGTERFIIGLAKKVLIANYMAQVADSIFAQSGMELSVATAWLGAVCYTLQIYYDFSGYSDMAIGLGLMFGFHFEENFNYPLACRDIRDFWRRWHISLSRWFRDYVYIPLGGNRRGKVREEWNLFTVWLLTGIWHGANWTFIAWGLFYFTVLTFERKTSFPQVLQKAWQQPLRRLYALVVVVIAWVLFRSNTIFDALAYLGNMFGVGASGLSDDFFAYYITASYGVLLAGLIFAFPVVPRLERFCAEAFAGNVCAQRRVEFVRLAILLLLFVLSVIVSVKSTYNPFIYFNF